MYKLENKVLPNNLYDMFPKNKLIHKYPTRHSQEFHLPLTRTILTHSMFTSAGPKFWSRNTFDDNLKLAPSIMTFKSSLKSHLLSSYKGSSVNHQQR